MQTVNGLSALVLNADYRPLSYYPLSVLPWEDAVQDVIAGRYSVVAEYDVEVHSPSLTMKVPSVVALRAFAPRPKCPAYNRANLFLRDRYRCQYCGTRCTARDLTFDHVIPKSRGGRGCWENIVAACMSCNLRKANLTPQEAGMRLLRQPKRPEWSEFYEAGRSLPPVVKNPAWDDFLYWTVTLDES